MFRVAARIVKSLPLCIALFLALPACGDGKLLKLSTTSPTGNAEAGAGSLNAEGGFCAQGAPVAPQVDLLNDGDRVGFGASAFGGRDGCNYHVTNGFDEGPGSLRDALERPEALWIVFDLDVDITLTRDIKPLSNKTVDGRGRKVTIKTFGLHIENQTNVVIENVAFVGNGQSNGEGDLADAITLFGAASTIWIDHCDFSNYGDGLVDMPSGATDITVSWSHFHDHDMVMLIGKENETAALNTRVTLHHDWFDHTTQYNPRMRYAHVHMFNNLLDSWTSYGAAASQLSQLYSDRNIYLADSDTDAIELHEGSDPTNGNVNKSGDLFRNGATLNEGTYKNDPSAVFQPTYEYFADDPGTDPDASTDFELGLRMNAGLRH